MKKLLEAMVCDLSQCERKTKYFKNKVPLLQTLVFS